MRAKIQKISKYAPSIFQGKLELAAKRRSVSLTIEHPVERAIFRALIAATVLLALSYVFLVGATILNVIARKEALAQTVNLATAVSQLESEYFALAQNVGPEDGSRLGLSPVSDTLYVYRPGNAAAASTDSNEI